MGRALSSLLVLVVTLAAPSCFSQTRAKVSDPRLEFVGNTLHISYDILNSTQEEKFEISIVIKDEDGNTINAKSLSGDIGEDIPGGRNKRVSWNLEADNVFINAYISVKINAIFIPPPEPEIVPVQEPEPEQEKQMEEQVVKTEDEDQVEEAKEPPRPEKETSYNRAGIIFQSLAIPGLGLSRVTKKPHWLRGVAGYGCLAGSIILNRRAIYTFDRIEIYQNPSDATNLFDKSVQQDNISEVLAYTAIGIWVMDFVWTIVGTSDLNKSPAQAQSMGISIGSKIDPLSYTPMVELTYRF